MPKGKLTRSPFQAGCDARYAGKSRDVKNSREQGLDLASAFEISEWYAGWDAVEKMLQPKPKD